MKKRRFSAACMALLLFSFSISPVFALGLENGEEALSTSPPAFTIELVEHGDSAGLYGTLSYLPADSQQVSVLYSYNGTDFYEVDDEDSYGTRQWDLNVSDIEITPALTQLCIGGGDDPFLAYQNHGVNSLYIKLHITHATGELDTAIEKMSHNKTWDLPATPPPFSVAIKIISDGYILKGSFENFLPNTAHAYPLYSLDGENYQRLSQGDEPLAWDLRRLGTGVASEKQWLENQLCAYSTTEPFKSYLGKTIDQF